ncbi:hypothetical protein H0A61_02383 [Koleobacter methoxysyntrophicus]|uniref:Uncharacterized protein n=1 Tax=Koleobacter methoxysyntrophicus TaxID=2751313 RepID=A0A8A0RNL9_9FIRM|nr:hypothetical protein [Koleobacter methoxysyntrophicus]QSQ09991.1 hypothetical protein H0A61_02383 [Koleobacter methoxysyntrophicus]
MGQIEKENGIIWKIKEYQYNLELELLLAKELGIPRSISRILVNRGIESVEAARKFLRFFGSISNNTVVKSALNITISGIFFCQIFA